jgi:tRNA(Ile)-lysidine synthase
MAADGGAPDTVSTVRAAAFAVLDRRLDPNSAAPVTVGLSGGGDSLALLVFALDWARAAGRTVLALTVDHRLNPDSARWTAEAGAKARALGADWRALEWSGPKPSTGLPAAARRARHALLAEAARAVGASVVLLGHTADDVAESALIRRETPSHGGLRDWAPSPVWPQGRGVFLLRPLLAVRRRALRDVLSAGGMGWLDDPANADTRFARPRARQALREGEPVRVPLEAALGRERAPSAFEVGADGVVSLGVAALAADRRRLARAICCAAGTEVPPSGAALARIAGRLGAGGAGIVTLGGARMVFDDGGVTLCRELGRRPPAALALPPGEPVVFDGRFEVRADAPGWRVAPLAGHAARLERADRRGLAGVAALARPALPVLVGEGDVARLPLPFGGGPGEARELVSGRLAAAFCRIDSEVDLARNTQACAVHGA